MDILVQLSSLPFQAIMIIHDGIKPVPITIKNPQVNAIFECFHDTIKNQIRPTFHSNPALCYKADESADESKK
jgi:hypothetical protein